MKRIGGGSSAKVALAPLVHVSALQISPLRVISALFTFLRQIGVSICCRGGLIGFPYSFMAK
jgi:hypothetical protein